MMLFWDMGTNFKILKKDFCYVITLQLYRADGYCNRKSRNLQMSQNLFEPRSPSGRGGQAFISVKGRAINHCLKQLKHAL